MITAMGWCLLTLLAVFSGIQLSTSTRYQTTGTSRQISYRYAYPSSRVLSGPNVCKSTCCPGWQLNPYTRRCTTPICRPQCRNGGRCLRPNQCTCLSGFFGSYCQHEYYIRPNTGPRPSGGSSMSSGRTSSGRPASTGGSLRPASNVGSLRPASNGGSLRPITNVGYGRTGVATSYRPANGGATTTTTIVRPGSASTSSGSRTYISRIRPATALSSGSSSRTYSLTYTSGQGNIVPTNNNGHQNNPPPSSTATLQGHSSTAVGLPSSQGLARFTMRGPCFRRVNSNHCMAPLSDVTTLHDDCCATVGQGWGDGCYPCPQVLGRELTCPRGFKKSAESGKCVDVDECTAFDNICMHGRCLNSRGSYRCRCDQGYMADSSGTQCLVSVKQMCYTRVISGQCYGGSRLPTTQMQCCCSLGVAWGARCEKCPHKGSAEFRAMCPQGTGYHYKPSNGYNHVSATVNSGNPQPTHRLDPCTTNSRLCLNGECISTGNGRYTCECRHGFRLNSRGNQCIDINECRETRDICGGGRCLNSYGSYHCICAQGLVTRSGTCEDVDECTSRSTNPCGEYVCLNTRGSFHCSRTECSEGYRYDVGFRRCVDVNECQMDNVCQHGRCINIEGSFHCICSNGFTSNPTHTDCIDVDECGEARDSPLCGLDAICINEVGNYRCHCRDDRIYDPTSKSCLAPAQGEPEIVEAERKECYGSISDVNLCSNLLGSNVTRQECCCSVGAGWGDNCDLLVCPQHGSATYNETCPVGKGKHVMTQRKPSSSSSSSSSSRPIYPDSAVHESRGHKATVSGINECEIFPDVCGTATCVDRDVLFDCTCNEGYKYDEERKTCRVRDYCRVYMGVCGNGTCENTETSYNCKCSGGYRFDSSNRRCIAINHCTSTTICGNGTCTSTESGPVCGCPTGYRFNRQQRTCEVSDYCSLFGEACGNGTCVNRRGGYDCRCPVGHVYSETSRTCEVRDFCIVLGGVCGNGTCIPTTSSYTCRCPNGFRYDSNAGACVDVNECRQTPGVCGNASCTNTRGSFRCSCDFGYNYDQARRLCVDVNECAEFREICSNGTCMNSLGSYKCVCPRGFKYVSGNGNGCVDVNECSDMPGVCGDAPCLNRQGDFLCRCEAGYSFDEQLRTCIAQETNEFGNNLEGHTTSRDPDALNEDNDCLALPDLCGNGTCAMGVQGGPVCTCEPGFQFDAPLKACVDNDECERNENICGAATCQNRIGGYSCACPEGFAYKKRKRSCADVNECKRYPGLCGTARCVNKRGSFTCTCPPGQRFDYPSRRCLALTPVDACSRNPGICGNGTCTSAGHSINCLCPTGYDYDPSIRHCTVTNECDVPNRCGPGAICEDTLSGYRCLCTEGYVYSEQGCREIPQPPPRATGSQGGQEQQAAPTGILTLPTKRGPNECDSGPCVNGVCIDRPDGFICQCTDGYQLVGLTTCELEINQPSSSGSSGSQERPQHQIVPASSQTTSGQSDANECDSAPCMNGICIDRPDGFICQCKDGYELVGSTRCADVNECENEDSHHMCMFGTCVNDPPGSYTCECTSPLTLDSTGRRCIELLGPIGGDMPGAGAGGGIPGGFPQEEPLETCWGQARPREDICSNVVAERSSYQACCCGSGVSWGDQCFACPIRNTEGYRMLCVPLSSYGYHGDSTDFQVADQPVPGIPRS